ncbi:MAG: ribosome small subunit-dependent GTPase A [Cytophagales bacterium]
MELKAFWRMASTGIKAEVYKSTGSWYTVKSESGDYFQCRLRGKFKLADKKVTNPIAVGDQVIIDLEKNHEGPNAANIVEILPRENYMIRKSPRKTAHSHIVASNLDLAVLLFTIKEPRTSRGFLDRYLLAAEAFGINATVLINKIDLLREKDLMKLEEIELIYRAIGYPVYSFSLKSGEGLAQVDAVFKGKKSLISGHSGSGKSSLLNYLKPDLDLRTAEISKFSNKGKHTTTFATMYDLGEQTKIIDTPGIKEFGIEDLEAYEISMFFPDLKDFALECRFNTCTHVHEPGCAVIDALENAQIDPDRYKSYLSIIQDEETHR